jgi:hypothetical protein
MSTFFCSTCKSLLPAENFGYLKYGKRKTTCNRHITRKRALELDDWDDFITEIREWNRPVQFSVLLLILNLT